MDIGSIRKEVAKHGLKLKVFKNGHLQIYGQSLTVNYYPDSKKRSVYVEGATAGIHGVTITKAIKIAKGEWDKQVSYKKSKRKGSYSKKRNRLYAKIKHCYWCNQFMEPEEVTLDHKIPLSKGGSNRNDNLCLAHMACNQAKDNDLPK